ncbi:MAG: hypothetical protein JO352_32755 [Chloroflexi bacterium]|nr:hypothetical protein [Chloroflexota bacterium]
MSAQSDFAPSEPEPTRALLLAHALDRCIQAERQVPGSANQIVARQPAWMRAELRRLLGLAGSLDAVAASAVMSEEFRLGARARLMRRITSTPGAAYVELGAAPTLVAGPRPGIFSPPPAVARVHKRRGRWVWRGAIGGILAAILAVVATLSASASSLPGQPLYSLKQATEELGVRLAPDDQARTLLLLRQANARLDETAQLLDEGRTDQAADTTQQFDNVLDQATTTYVVTIAAAPAQAQGPTTAQLETTLSQQQAQLQLMLATAPEPARAELREALVATERSRALVADPEEKPTPAATGPTQTDGDADIAAPTDTPPRPARAFPPPPVDLVAQKPDVKPFTPASADDTDHHEVQAQQAVQAQAEKRKDTPAATASTPAVASGPGGDSPRVEHLRIPPLAPVVAPAQTGSAGQQAQDVQPDDGSTAHASGRRALDAVQPPNAISAPENPPQAADDHADPPSPNPSVTRARAAQAPPPPVAAHQSAPASDNASTTAAPPQVAAQPASAHAAGDPGGAGHNAQPAPSPPTPRPPSTPAPAQSDAHQDGGATGVHSPGNSGASATNGKGSSQNTAGGAGGGNGNASDSSHGSSSGGGNSSNGGGNSSSSHGKSAQQGGGNNNDTNTNNGNSSHH